MSLEEISRGCSAANEHMMRTNLPLRFETVLDQTSGRSVPSLRIENMAMDVDFLEKLINTYRKAWPDDLPTVLLTFFRSGEQVEQIRL